MSAMSYFRIMNKITSKFKAVWLFLSTAFFTKLFDDNLPSLTIKRSYWERLWNFCTTYTSEFCWVAVCGGALCGLLVIGRFIVRYWVLLLIAMIVIIAKLILANSPTQRDKETALALLFVALTALLLWKLIEHLKESKGIIVESYEIPRTS
jgi:hypothetical protein